MNFTRTAILPLISLCPTMRQQYKDPCRPRFMVANALAASFIMFRYIFVFTICCVHQNKSNFLKNAIWRRVKKYGLQFAYSNCAVFEKYVKELIALALLPADQVLVGYQVSGYWWEVVDLFNSNVGILLQNIKAHFSDLLRRETAEIQAGIKKLNNYFLSYWIGEITPEVFSVFGLINRTN